MIFAISCVFAQIPIDVNKITNNFGYIINLINYDLFDSLKMTQTSNRSFLIIRMHWIWLPQYAMSIVSRLNLFYLSDGMLFR